MKIVRIYNPNLYLLHLWSLLDNWSPVRISIWDSTTGDPEEPMVKEGAGVGDVKVEFLLDFLLEPPELLE